MVTFRGIATTVRGRLNLPSMDILRIQKAIPNALQILSERLSMDENKRHIILTPRTVTGTPTAGILDLTALVTSNRLMIDKLHLGYIYNSPTNTFTSGSVSTVADTITITNHGYSNGTRVRFTTSNALPAPLAISTDYYVLVSDANTFQLYTNPSDVDSIVNLTTTGTGTQTILTPDLADTQPLMQKNNQDFAGFSMCFASSTADKFWWLVGNSLYAFDGQNNPIATALQFNVPHSLLLSEFNSNSAIASTEDELVDLVTEIVRDSQADRDNEEEN